MNQGQIREKFLDFFKEREHTIVSSSSLLPDDPSVLFTTAGMQQFKPYYTRKADPIKDFNSLNTVSIQKSMRTSDIEEVGDDSHLTFFEMMGNFSFGGYFKKESIEWAYQFITKEMGLEIDYVSVFEGGNNIPADEESEKIWKEVDPSIRIKKFGMADNFWGPTGNEGPCGPTTEIYVKNAKGDSVEIWNVVFNEFYYPGSREDLESGTTDKNLNKLEFPGIDTGMGIERLAMVSQKTGNIFDTDLFLPIIETLPDGLDQKSKRIVADHMRASVFLISDGITPSNTDQGYILRRLLRRVIRLLAKESVGLDIIVNKIIQEYGDHYLEIKNKKDQIVVVINAEAEKFKQTLANGLGQFEKIVKQNKQISGEDAFQLYATYGFPVELTEELAIEKGAHVDMDDFNKSFEKHQKLSKAGAEKKFGGHGLITDTGELKAKNEEELQKATRLHTATHILQTALRIVLGNEVEQKGSDINADRLRFDFSFPRKLTDEEKEKVEKIVNEAIKNNLNVKKEEMPYEKAIEEGALAFFRQKYPKTVNVYSITDPKTGKVFSKELCGGPHVNLTGEIGKFRIKKEESSSAGVRRIKAVIE